MDNMNTSCFPIALAALKSAKSANERIDTLPLPMVFKGTLGTGGTIETLPAASSANEGYVYIVITNGTYSGQTAKAGDLFVSDGTSWVLVPSADEPSVIDDSVTSTELTWSSDKINTEFNGVKIKSFTYTGTGSATNTITFPKKPNYIIKIIGESVSYFHGVDGFSYNDIFAMAYITGKTVTSGPNYFVDTILFNDKELTITGRSENYSCNTLGDTFTVYYI